MGDDRYYFVLPARLADFAIRDYREQGESCSQVMSRIIANFPTEETLEIPGSVDTIRRRLYHARSAGRVLAVKPGPVFH